MKAAIEQALTVLVGLPMWAAGRAATIHWFASGDAHETTDRRGEVRTVGEYALHIQYMWHLAGPTGIIVAFDDRYLAAGDESLQTDDDWDWDRQGMNRCDERINAFCAARTANPPIVTAIAADHLGGIRLTLDDDLILATFPSNSLDLEHWRLFQPGIQGHFVVTGAGIEE